MLYDIPLIRVPTESLSELRYSFPISNSYPFSEDIELEAKNFISIFNAFLRLAILSLKSSPSLSALVHCMVAPEQT